MVWEIVGSGGSAEHTAAVYGEIETELMKLFITKCIGHPPQGATLEVRPVEHELGMYLQIQVGWDAYDEEEEYWDYLNAAREAFSVINENIDWESLWNDYPLSYVKYKAI